MISLVNISKTYDKKILDNINLSFDKGNIYVIKGVSGSGKTTLLNIISGLDINFDGELFYESISVKNNSDFLELYRKKIGYVTQKSLLFKNVSIIENLKFIENNEEKIISLSKKFDVYDLLDKFPYQLSGGERQRISLIRALLNDNEIIIADEPTSALDYNNSINFVNYLKKIDISDKIIIIATHKDIYSELCDFKIEIEYGKVNIVKNDSKCFLNNYKGRSKSRSLKEHDSRSIINDFKFILKKNKKKNIIVNVFMIILFLILFFSLSLKINFKNEYIKLIAKQKNYDIIDLTLSESDYVDDLIEYKYYEYNIYEKDYTAYNLLHREDSNLNLPGIIAYGSFPKSDNEILVNEEFAKIKFENVDYSKIIGKKVILKNNELVISGIVKLTDENYIELYASNYFYRNINKSGRGESLPSIFIPYDLMKSIGEKKPDYNTDKIIVKIKEQYLVDIYNGSIFNSSNGPKDSVYNTWENRILMISKDAEFVANISILSFLVFGVIAIIFISNGLSLKLYYRKKEIGFLQIFHISKLEISIIIISEYLLNIFKMLFLSIITYLFISIILNIILSIDIMIPIYLLAFVLVILISYSAIVVYIPLRRYLKMNIIDLIN